MKREDILGFVATIIRNGVENNVDAERVKESIVNYGKYLKAQNFADEETVNTINSLANCSKELLNLARVMSKNELPITGIVDDISLLTIGRDLGKAKKFIPIDMMSDFGPRGKEVEQGHDYSYGTVIGSCLAPSRQPDYSCGSSRPSIDPCSSSRSVSPSTCGSSYDDYSSSGSCSSGRSLGGRSC